MGFDRDDKKMKKASFKIFRLEEEWYQDEEGIYDGDHLVADVNGGNEPVVAEVLKRLITELIDTNKISQIKRVKEGTLYVAISDSEVLEDIISEFQTELDEEIMEEQQEEVYELECPKCKRFNKIDSSFYEFCGYKIQ